MSVFRLLAMLMKKNELKSLSGDVDENTGSYLAQLPSLGVALFENAEASLPVNSQTRWRRKAASTSSCSTSFAALFLTWNRASP